MDPMFTGFQTYTRRFCLLLAAALCCLICTIQPVFAQIDAWSIEVAVANRSDQEQEAAYGVALRRVLLANSGDKTLLNRDDVRKGLRDAKSYVEEFRYRTPAPGTAISRDAALTEAVRTSGQATQLMLVRFDRERVRELIESDKGDEAEENLIEPFSRVSSALVWMLIEDEGRRILISDAAAEKVRERLRELAGAAGVSLKFPVGDDEDQQALSFESPETFSAAQIRRASERYGQPFTLVGYIKRSGALGWKGQWIRLDDSQPLAAGVVDDPGSNASSESGSGLDLMNRFRDDPTAELDEFTTPRLDEALQAGLGWLTPSAGADSTNYQYGGSNASDAEMLIAISSVNSTRSYSDLVSFLSEIEGVNGVYPKEISDDIMILSVYPKSAFGSISDAVDRQDWLRRTAPVLRPPSANLFGQSRGQAQGQSQQGTGSRVSALARDIELTLDLLN